MVCGPVVVGICIVVVELTDCCLVGFGVGWDSDCGWVDFWVSWFCGFSWFAFWFGCLELVVCLGFVLIYYNMGWHEFGLLLAVGWLFWWCFGFVSWFGLSFALWAGVVLMVWVAGDWFVIVGGWLLCAFGLIHRCCCGFAVSVGCRLVS